MEYSKPSSRTVAIGDLVEIQPGFQFRKEVDSHAAGSIGVLQIKDIEDRRRLKPETIERADFDRSVDAYRVDRGDVLFLSRGHHQFAIAIEHDLTDTIAAGYFYILRLRTHIVRPAFLAWAINQDPFQNQLAPLSQGSHMPFVSKAKFQDLKIPVPPLERQDAIVAIADLARVEQDLLALIAQKRAALIATLTNAATH